MINPRLLYVEVIFLKIFVYMKKVILLEWNKGEKSEV